MNVTFSEDLRKDKKMVNSDNCSFYDSGTTFGYWLLSLLWWCYWRLWLVHFNWRFNCGSLAYLPDYNYRLSDYEVVSFAAVIRVVTERFSPLTAAHSSSAFLSLSYWEPVRNNMQVTVSSCTNHIARYICRQRSRFPRNTSLLLIGQFKERNAELEWAAVSGEEHRTLS